MQELVRAAVEERRACIAFSKPTFFWSFSIISVPTRDEEGKEDEPVRPNR